MMNHQAQLEQYLRMMMSMRQDIGVPPDFTHSCPESFVLTHGRAFEPGPEKPPRDLWRGSMGECFKNATYLAALRDEFLYVEGFATCIIPCAHAWVVNKVTGQIFDPTWEDGMAYFGVVFKTTYVKKAVLLREHYGLLDNWNQNYPLLREEEGHEPKDFAEELFGVVH